MQSIPAEVGRKEAHRIVSLLAHGLDRTNRIGRYQQMYCTDQMSFEHYSWRPSCSSEKDLEPRPKRTESVRLGLVQKMTN